MLCAPGSQAAQISLKLNSTFSLARSLSLSLSLARALSLSLLQVLQIHDGMGDSASEYSLQWPGPRDTAHTFLDSGPGSTLGQGMGANPNGDATRTDLDCRGTDRGRTINGAPCVKVPCTPLGLRVKDIFFFLAILRRFLEIKE